MVRRHEDLLRLPADGRGLFYRLWEPAACQALLVVVHGFGEHSGRYDSLGCLLAEQGMAVACPDLFGHGRSEGRRGDVAAVSRYLDDLNALATHLAARLRQERLAVFGHSFGGLAALHWALQASPTLGCVVLQSPLLQVGFPVARWKTGLAGLLERVAPMLAVPTGLDPQRLSHNPQIVQRYQADPLVQHRITLRGYRRLQAAMAQGREQAARLAHPTLMLLGGDDRIVSTAACRTVFAQLTCEKRLVEFPGCYHELHHEAVGPQVVELITQWVRQHA
ncbi:MAG: lysophospholipase [Candidatus Omnitrophica bacterium]|nr:lysophospholipase [Candidatus Omnitrophota bacterium]